MSRHEAAGVVFADVSGKSLCHFLNSEVIQKTVLWNRTWIMYWPCLERTEGHYAKAP